MPNHAANKSALSLALASMQEGVEMSPPLDDMAPWHGGVKKRMTGHLPYRHAFESFSCMYKQDDPSQVSRGFFEKSV
jgi:hypothetical protein